MIRDMMVPVAELLFWLMDGVALGNSFLVIPWIIFWVMIMAAPLSILVWTQKYVPVEINGQKFYRAQHDRRHGMIAFGFAILFFPALLMAMGPVIVQEQMLNECRGVPVEFRLPGRDITTVDMAECRFKTNYYDEFGPWEFQRINPDRLTHIK